MSTAFKYPADAVTFAKWARIVATHLEGADYQTALAHLNTLQHVSKQTGHPAHAMQGFATLSEIARLRITDLTVGYSI